MVSILNWIKWKYVKAKIFLIVICIKFSFINLDHHIREYTRPQEEITSKQWLALNKKRNNKNITVKKHK